jgi:hypothetical protein
MGWSGGQRVSRWWEDSQNAFCRSTCNAPTANALKAGGLSGQTLVESSGEQGFRAGSNSDAGPVKTHIPPRGQRAREL